MSHIVMMYLDRRIGPRGLGDQVEVLDVFKTDAFEQMRSARSQWLKKDM